MAKATKITVKQDMIDFIKTQGMARALKRAGQINAKGTKGEAEFIEGVRRMYGARRLAEATKSAAPAAPKKPVVGTKNRPVMVDAKGPNAIKPAATKTMYNRLTGEKITYTESPKTSAKPKAKEASAAPKYNRYTGEKVDYTTKTASKTAKPKEKKVLPPAPKYNRFTQQKIK